MQGQLSFSWLCTVGSSRVSALDRRRQPSCWDLGLKLLFSFSAIHLAALLRGSDSVSCGRLCDDEDRPWNATSREWGPYHGCCVARVPSDIPSDALNVDLSQGVISGIPDGAFRHLSECVELDLHFNEILSIDNRSFEGLHSLQVLDMGEKGFFSSGISTIPRGCFSDLLQLKRLYLNRNRISRIENGAFDNLRLLEELYLQDNDIESFEKGLFDSLTSLQTLDISENKLTSLGPDLLINQPRPLHLMLSVDDWLNISSLCWLQHEEKHVTVFLNALTWSAFMLDGPDLSSAQCGDQGESGVLRVGERIPQWVRSIHACSWPAAKMERAYCFFLVMCFVWC